MSLRNLKVFFTKTANNNSKYLALPSAKNPRVIIPVNSRNHFKTGFDIHNTASPKNRLIKEIIKHIYPIPKLLNKNIVYETQEIDRVRIFLKNKLKISKELFFSFYIGTPSNNQKLTIQTMDQSGAVLGYLKITDNEISESFIIKEYESSKYLNKLKYESFVYPKALFFDKINSISILFQEDISENTLSIGYKLSVPIISALSELAVKTKSQDSVSDYLRAIVLKFNTIIQKNALLFKGAELIHVWKDELLKYNFPLVYIHGDFVPYNIRIKKSKLAIFDWEFSREHGLPGYDLFHFIFQGSYQIFKSDADKLIINILNEDSEEFSLILKYFNSFNIKKNLIPHFLLFYLIEAFLYDINIRPQNNYSKNHFLQAIINLINYKG